MEQRTGWIRTGVRLMLAGLLLVVLLAPFGSNQVFADGKSGGQPGAPPCDTCGVGYVPPDDTNPDQGLISLIEIALLTMPVTGI